ncbi:MAG: hypothetical protein ABFS35_22310 [Bacteroidota bacterium]
MAKKKTSTSTTRGITKVKMGMELPKKPASKPKTVTSKTDNGSKEK